MDITPLDVRYEDVRDNAVPPAGLAPELTVTESSPMTSEARALGRDSPDAAPVVPSEEPVQVFGYLQKQGRRLKGWHPRWFEIRGQHMYYYKTNAKKQCLGEIQLSICTQVQPATAATFGHPFDLVTEERSHTLAARTVEDMEKWIDTIKKNMGRRPGPKPKKMNKVKKWDSFKNAFAITKHRSVSPQNSNPLPTASLPANMTAKVDVNRNKSFLDKFKRIKRERSDSPAGRDRRVDLREEEKKMSRPHSEDILQYSKQKLQANLEDPPMAVSVPTTPVAKKRNRDTLPREEQTSPSPSPHPTRTPSPPTSPEHTPKKVVAATPPSPPRHTSTPVIIKTPPPPDKEKPVIFAKPRPLVDDTSSKKQTQPRRQHVKKETPSPVSQPADDKALPKILTQPLAWDEIQETLASLHEDSKPLFTDMLPPEDEPWMEKDTPIEQLREFLAICA